MVAAECAHLRHQQCGLVVLRLRKVHLLLVLSPRLAALIGVVPEDAAIETLHFGFVAAAS